MDFGLSLAPLSFLGNLIGGIFGKSSSDAQADAMIRATQMTNQTNERINRENNEWNRNLWLEQTAYNTPAKQAERYLAAGINPYMALSNISSGEASTAPQMQAMQYQNPAEAYALKAQNAMQLGQQIGDAASNAANLYSSAKLQSAEAEKASSEAKLNTIDALFRAMKNAEEIGLLKSQKDKFSAEKVYQDSLNYIMHNTQDASIAGAKADAEYKQYLAKNQFLQNVVFEHTGLRMSLAQVHQLEATCDNLLEDTYLKKLLQTSEFEKAKLYIQQQLSEQSLRKVYSSQVGVNGAQAGYYGAQTRYTNELKRGAFITNKQAVILSPWVLKQTIEDYRSSRLESFWSNRWNAFNFHWENSPFGRVGRFFGSMLGASANSAGTVMRLSTRAPK